MKAIFVFGSWIILGCTSILLMAANANTSQDQLVGEWLEQQWQYEQASEQPNSFGSANLEETINNQLVWHRSEAWTFSAKGDLYMKSSDTTTIAHWCLKGRANVLVITYPDGQQEQYNLSRVSTDSLVLHFESQIQARGIAKLTFTKKKPC